jgi:PAS domain S-box-containing protein
VVSARGCRRRPYRRGLASGRPPRTGGLVGHFAEKRKALEERVSRHEELSFDLMCMANFDGFFTRLNPSWTCALGYSTTELMAEPFLSFVHPDDREATLAEAERQTKAGEHVLHFANRYRHKDGSYRWLEWMSRPDADVGELIAVARDITARKTAEETAPLPGAPRARGERTYARSRSSTT